MYTFEPKRDPGWKSYVGDPFDISLDPVRMTQMAAGALTFLRGDVRPARADRGAQSTPRSGVREPPACRGPSSRTSRRVSRWRCRSSTRCGSVARQDAPTRVVPAAATGPIVSDTRELTWHTTTAKNGTGDGRDGPHAGAHRLRESANAVGFEESLGGPVATSSRASCSRRMDGKPIAQSAQTAAHRRLARQQHRPQVERRRARAPLTRVSRRRSSSLWRGR